MYPEAGMREPARRSPGGPEQEPGADGSGMAKAVYILYLIAVLFTVTAIAGVVLAYVNRGDAPDWLRSHYTFQVRTFWIGLLGTIVGSVLTLILVGWLLLLFVLIWWLVRCAKGLKLLGTRSPVPDPETWGW